MKASAHLAAKCTTLHQRRSQRLLVGAPRSSWLPCICRHPAQPRVERLYSERAQEAAGWAQVHRKFYEIHRANAAPIAAEPHDRVVPLCSIGNGWRVLRLGGDRTAATCSLMGAAKLSGVAPRAYLHTPRYGSPTALSTRSTSCYLGPWLARVPSLRTAARRGPSSNAEPATTDSRAESPACPPAGQDASSKGPTGPR
jgi:hypothetical protein